MNLYNPGGNWGGGLGRSKVKALAQEVTEHTHTLTLFAPGSWEVENFGNGERESEGWLGARLP